MPKDAVGKEDAVKGKKEENSEEELGELGYSDRTTSKILSFVPCKSAKESAEIFKQIK